MPPRLVLASASPARRALLRAAGVEPEVRVSGVDERAVARTLASTAPREVAAALARAKAEAVVRAGRAAPSAGEELVLGCDSVLDLDGEPLGRPADAADARRRWRRLAGREAVLVTGHCLVAPDPAGDRVAQDVASAVVRFGRPLGSELDAYLATGEPLDVAGSFTLDGYGGWFVEGVDGAPSTVVGLSLPLLRSLLARLGVAVVDLWDTRRDPVVGGAHGTS